MTARVRRSGGGVRGKKKRSPAHWRSARGESASTKLTDAPRTRMATNCSTAQRKSRPSGPPYHSVSSGDGRKPVKARDFARNSTPGSHLRRDWTPRGNPAGARSSYGSLSGWRGRHKRGRRSRRRGCWLGGPGRRRRRGRSRGRVCRRRWRLTWRRWRLVLGEHACRIPRCLAANALCEYVSRDATEQST